MLTHFHLRNERADIYRTNMFHLAVGGCALVLQKDLEYWAIDELMMEPCCALKYYPEIEICHNEKQVRTEETVTLAEGATMKIFVLQYPVSGSLCHMGW